MKDPNYYRAEAVAMRRIIAERGYPLALGWEPPPLDDSEQRIDLGSLAEAEAKRYGRPYSYAGKGLSEPRQSAPRGDGPGRRAEYKTLTLDELQERERERNRRRHEKDRAKASASPEPIEAVAPKAPAPKPAPARAPGKRLELKPLSESAKAKALAEIAARAPQASPSPAAEPAPVKIGRWTPEQAERRKIAERDRRKRRAAEIAGDPEKLEAHRARRRELDRAARERQGAIPRPENWKENAAKGAK